jgi:HEPN superfamily protein
MGTNAQMHPDATTPRVTPSALTLLMSARHELSAGKRDYSAASRCAAARLAALRAAAAVLTAKPEPSTTARTECPWNVWELLPRVEPALSEWAAYFAAKAELPFAVSLQEADKRLQDAETFVSLAEETLSRSLTAVTYQPQSGTPGYTTHGSQP